MPSEKLIKGFRIPAADLLEQALGFRRIGCDLIHGCFLTRPGDDPRQSGLRESGGTSFPFPYGTYLRNQAGIDRQMERILPDSEKSSRTYQRREGTANELPRITPGGRQRETVLVGDF